MTLSGLRKKDRDFVLDLKDFLEYELQNYVVRRFQQGVNILNKLICQKMEKKMGKAYAIHKWSWQIKEHQGSDVPAHSLGFHLIIFPPKPSPLTSFVVSIGKPGFEFPWPDHIVKAKVRCIA